MKLAVAALALVAISGCSAATERPATPPAKEVAWRPFAKEAFADARAGKKLVLLDLGTGWCHWCHVMDETTYRDPEVVALLHEHFVALRADADARLDLASRYEAYGWPATVLFDANGTELAKLRGYQEPARMISLLRAFVADPTPGPSALVDTTVAPASSAALGATERAALFERYARAYDEKNAGWGDVHKFVDLDSIELAMRRGLEGDAPWDERARKTLDAERRFLVDPVWGGAYQYSHGGVWETPHFEKILSRQAADMEAFALAYARWHDPAHLEAARAIERYLVTFLSAPDGTFYASQDADLVKGEHGGAYFSLDDAGRRKLGVPAIDEHVYARENGWAIEALCALFAASGDEKTLARATNAAEKILASHAVGLEGVPGTGFKHDASNPGLYLADTLAMGRALVALHHVTGERRWLDRSCDAARFAAKVFATDAGFSASRPTAGDLAPPRPDFDENVALARWMNALHRETGDASFREHAEHAMRFVAAPAATARRGHFVAGALLADEELREEPLHVTVKGEGDDARALVRAALALPTRYVVIEREGGSGAAHALLCGHGVCRPPVRDAATLARVAGELLHRP